MNSGFVYFLLGLCTGLSSRHECSEEGDSDVIDESSLGSDTIDWLFIQDYGE